MGLIIVKLNFFLFFIIPVNFVFFFLSKFFIHGYVAIYLRSFDILSKQTAMKKKPNQKFGAKRRIIIFR